MKLVTIFEGPTLFAGMLRDALAARGVGSIVQAAEPYLGLIGDAVQPPFSVLRIGEADQYDQAEAIAECLAMVAPLSGDGTEGYISSDWRPKSVRMPSNSNGSG